MEELSTNFEKKLTHHNEEIQTPTKTYDSDLKSYCESSIASTMGSYCLDDLQMEDTDVKSLHTAPDSKLTEDYLSQMKILESKQVLIRSCNF